MKDSACVQFLQWALPKLQMRWPGFRKVRRQVCKRIHRRIQHLGLEDFEAYRNYLGRTPEEWSALGELCRISISRFYRDRGVFDVLREKSLPLLAESAMKRGDHEIRVWSAGCASGEEPYTIKMIWEMSTAPQFPDLSLRIVATDVDAQLLERARRGCYPSSSLKDTPDTWNRDAFQQLEDRGKEKFCVRDRFRTGVEFWLQDIREEQPAEQFDMILCRNMACTYFEAALQKEVLTDLLARLISGGILVVGKHEQPPSPVGILEEVAANSGIYQKLTHNHQSTYKKSFSPDPNADTQSSLFD